MRKLIASIALVGVLSLVTTLQAATEKKCPPGTTNPAYCTTVTINPVSGGGRQSKALAKAVAEVLANDLTPSALTRTIAIGSITVTIAPGSAPGTYTVTLTNAQGLVIGNGTATVAGKAADVAGAAKAKGTKLKVKLTKAGKDYLQHHKKHVTIKVSTKYKPKHGKTQVSKTTVTT